MKMKEGLLLKYLNGTCSKKQRAKVLSWVAEDIAHSQELDRLKMVWSEFDNLKSFKSPSIKEDWKMMSSLIGVHGVPESVAKDAKVTEVITPSEVTLTPKPITASPAPVKKEKDSVKSIDSKAAIQYKPPIVSKNPTTNTKVDSVSKTYEPETKVDSGIPLIDRVVYIIGAIIAATIIGVAIWQFTKKKSPIVDIASVETSKSITLPDGSEVVLDPYSRLSYPRDMGDHRRLSLVGAAEFDIMADTEPMIVDYGEVSVMSQGTAFDLEKGDDFVSVECLDGRIMFFETADETNNVNMVGGDKYKYANGIFENMNTPEIDAPQLPDLVSGEKVRLDLLLDWLMEESDWKVTSTPSMPFDRDHEIIVDLDQSYTEVLISLRDKLNIDFESASCSGCYLIKKMKAL